MTALIISDPIWITLITVIGTLIGGLIKGEYDRRKDRKDNRQTAREIREIKHQVQNSHPTNLRDDLDALAAAVASLRTEVAALRIDVQAQHRDTTGLHEVAADASKEHSRLWQAIDGIRHPRGKD